MSQQDQHATELNRAEKIFGVPFPTGAAAAAHRASPNAASIVGTAARSA